MKCPICGNIEYYEVCAEDMERICKHTPNDLIKQIERLKSENKEYLEAIKKLKSDLVVWVDLESKRVKRIGVLSRELEAYHCGDKI